MRGFAPAHHTRGINIDIWCRQRQDGGSLRISAAWELEVIVAGSDPGTTRAGIGMAS